MSNGTAGLRKVQFGIETSLYTTHAATQIWRGKFGGLDDQRVVKFVEEDIGLLVPTNRVYQPMLLGKLALPSVEATFHQLPYLGEAGIKAVTTGAADGSGTDKIYSYPLSTTAVNTLKSLSFETGDDQQAELMAGGTCEDFTLSGKWGEALMMSSNWIGRQVATGSFTGALTASTVETILFDKGKLYVDAIGGTIGTTQKSNTLYGLTYKVATGRVPIFTGDGNLYFNFVGFDKKKVNVTAEITFLHETAGIAAKAAFKASTPLQVQLKWEGAAIATPGTTYSVNTLLLNNVGTWSNVSILDESEGQSIVKATFRAAYDATPALYSSMILAVDALTSLT